MSRLFGSKDQGWERQHLSVCCQLHSECQHLPQGLSAGKCEPHWPGPLSRLSLKSKGTGGKGERV